MSRHEHNRGAGRGGRRLKMKDLERATGVGREAIRFYIREGLVPEPERPARNVAWYDESFVERILLIKKLQSERFLPLSVIKSVLGGKDVPSPDEVQTLLALDGKLQPTTRGDARTEPETVAALAKRVGLPPTEIRELAHSGAIEIVTRKGREWVEGSSLEVVELWAEMRQAGFSKELGFEPEQVALPLQMAEWLAREQLRIFTRQVTGRVPPGVAHKMAEAGLRCVPRLTRLFHEAMLLKLLATGNAPADTIAPSAARAS
jgi:DNA-binding transcriptional MerR regulator